MSKERIKAVLWASLVTGVLTRLIVLGSKNLTHFDAVLMPYTVATLVCRVRSHIPIRTVAATPGDCDVLEPRLAAVGSDVPSKVLAVAWSTDCQTTHRRLRVQPLYLEARADNAGLLIGFRCGDV
ncbi:MAG: hypothetical protein KatS3mg105_3704 [Gemmatales bacterium]|nr:MAG: hypothetical protein KatS3mg105_3704 [Gemmatales bacterium]